MPDPLRQSVSATEAPALLDASPYTTRWMLYRRFKLGEELASKEHNRMNWGKRFEPALLQGAAERLHMDVIPNTHGDGGTQAYVRRRLLGCTKDATVICPDRGPGALEAKFCFDGDIWMRDWNGGKQPPRHIEIQNQVQQFVGDGETPYRWGVIAVFSALLSDMVFFERRPIPELWGMLETKTQEFFADVEAGREPPAFGSPVEVPFLARAFPVIKGKVLDLSEVMPIEDMPSEGMPLVPEEQKRRQEYAEDARMLRYYSSERLGYEASEETLKAKFLALAGDAETVLLPSGIRLKVSQISRGAYNVKPTTYKTVKVFVPEGL